MDQDPNTKSLFISETKNKQTKNIIYEKEKEQKMRVETKTWGLTEEELSHGLQLTILNGILDETVEKTKYSAMMVSHIKDKISGYKQQDILKKKLNETNFVTYINVINLLKECELKCHYCSQPVYLLYERVREMKQWSLDRIDNNIGHNTGNLLIACLECNLKRRRTNKDAFMFTKNLVITREGL